MAKSSIPRAPMVAMFLLGVGAVAYVVFMASTGAFTRGGRAVKRDTRVLERESVAALTDPRTREGEIRRLVATRKMEAVPILRQFTKNDDAELRRLCVWGLGELGFQDAVHALRVRVQDEDVKVRTETAKAMGKLYDDVAYEGLEDLLADRDPAVRVAAAETLGGALHDNKAVDGLTQALRDTNAVVRLAVTTSLAGGRDARVHPGLLKAAKDPSDDVRLAAVKALAARDADEVAAALAEAMTDASPPVRAAAGAAARRVGKTILPHVARSIATARSIAARSEAVDVLEVIGGPETAPALIRALDGVDPRSPPEGARALRDRVVALLTGMGDAVVASLDETAIAGGCGPLAKSAAAAVCAGIGRPAVGPIVRHLLRWRMFPDAEELKTWVRTLGEIGDPEAAPALNRALAQQADGIEEWVDKARRAIEAKSGRTLPPAKPDLGFGDPEVEEFAFPRKPDFARLFPAAPPAAGEKGLPENAQVTLGLSGALLRGYKAERSSADMDVTLTRRAGKWDRPARGLAREFNQAGHEGVVVRASDGERTALRVEMVVHDDPWVKGGFGEYDIEFSAGRDGLRGTYRGRYDYQDVSGEVRGRATALTGRKEGVPELQPGEHPRLLFRKHELPILRARAATEFGRRIIKAVREKIAEARQEDESGLDLAIGCGLLYALYEDEPYGRMALPMLRWGVDNPGGGHPHDTAYKLIDLALGYDLAYNCMTAAERETFNEHLSRVGNIITERSGLAGNFNNGPNSNWTAIGCGGAGLAALAVLREKGSIGRSAPQKFDPVYDFAPDPARAQDGVPVNEFEPGRILGKWLVNGPFPASGEADPLASLGGREKAMPRDGTKVTFGGSETSFVPLPEGAVVQAAGFGKKPERIALPGARTDTRTYLYGLVNANKVQGAVFDCSFPARFKECRIWVNGTKIDDPSVVIFQPGKHGVLLEAVGEVVSPFLFAANANFLYGQYQRYRQLLRNFEAVQAEYDRTGEIQDVPLKLEVAKENTRRWWAHSLGDRGWGTECGYEHAYGCLAPFTMAYETAMGESLVAGSGFPWLIPLEMASQHGLGLHMVKTTSMAYLLHTVQPELLPAAVWAFNQRYPPDSMGYMSCKELAFALVNYPLDVKPEAPESIMPKSLEDTRKGGFVFRNGYKGKDDIVANLFLRSAPPSGPCYFYSQSGSFRISGLGCDWVTGRGGDKRDWRYVQESVVVFDGNNGRGLGKKKYCVLRPDGSGIVGADMSEVYRAGGEGSPSPNVKAERHFAADYSGRSGAPALFALVDRVHGGPAKTWLLHAGAVRGERDSGLGVRIDGAGFEIAGPGGASMRGRFISPADVALSVGSVTSRLEKAVSKSKVTKESDLVFAGNTLRARSESRDADFFVIMTLQRGPAPEWKATGSGLAARVQVGGQDVRFDGERIVLQE